MAFVRMIDVLIAADARTQGEIAKASGLKPKHLSDKLKGKHKKLTDADVRAIARALRVDSGVLLSRVSKKKLLELAEAREKSSQVIDKPAQLPEPIPTPIARHLYALPAPSPTWVEVPRWRSAAASRFSLGELREDGKTRVPEQFKKCRAVVVSGGSMTKAGIDDGDIVIVDEFAEPRSGDIVVAEINGDTLLKRLVVRGKAKLLASESDEHGDVKIGDQGVRVLGVARMAYTPKKIK